MRTAAYKVGVACDRRRRKNVPRHILCSMNAKEQIVYVDFSAVIYYDTKVK